MRSSLLFAASGLASLATARVGLEKRHEDGSCAANPSGVAGYVNNPDTLDTFLNNPAYTNAANGATTPQGYSKVFSNLQAAIIDNAAYLGYDSIQSYDTGYCAQRCNSAWPGCSSFDIYFERDAVIDPGVNCTNPPSLTYIKCAYYSACEAQTAATNTGQYCQDFQHVIAGSNLYALSGKCSTSSSSTSTATSVSTTASATTNTLTTPVWSPVPKSTTTSTLTTTTTSKIPGWTTITSSISKSTTWATIKTTTATADTTSRKSISTNPAPTYPACVNGPSVDSKGQKWNVLCNENSYGHDLGPVPAASYQDCFDICKKIPQCNAFSWDPTTSSPVSCWPKNIPTGVSPQPYSQSGVVLGQMIPSSPACAPGLFTDGVGQQWELSCGSNFRGSDCSQQFSSCFEDCFDLCHGNKLCNAFTFAEATNTCWMKNIHGTGKSPSTFGDSGSTFAFQVCKQSPSSGNLPSLGSWPPSGGHWQSSSDSAPSSGWNWAGSGSTSPSSWGQGSHASPSGSWGSGSRPSSSNSWTAS